MTRSWLDGGDGDGHKVLGPSLINYIQNTTTWPLCPTYERAKDDRQLILFIYMRMEPNMFDEILNRVGLESKRLTPISGKHLNQTCIWPESQEHSRSVAEAPRLAMPK